MKPKPEDYVRMFAGSSFSYLFSDVFWGYYNALGVICVQDENSWMSFLPASTVENTRKEGKELYSNKALYDAYYAGFSEYIRESSIFFESLLGKEKFESSEVGEMLRMATKHFSFYSKTEFFYTDSLDQKEMVLTVPEFDKLKLDGRAYLNKILFEQNGFLRTLVKKLSVQLQIPELDLLNYSAAEIVALVDTGTKVDDKTVKDRNVFLISKNFTEIGEKARDVVDAFLASYKEISSIIRGKIAYKGKVTAKAYVIPADFKNFGKMSEAVSLMKEGEILVAETTAPEIIAACKKAAAIITNQGGMLSHAAIVSRELKIPCIIGTDKDVTLNIKTGDILEVDAEKGIITVVK